ncbi:MAG TPA: chloride channel protein [Patescibacteria group bacterium]|nr:chloride channel protein [Patescibacteria group bacterium]
MRNFWRTSFREVAADDAVTRRDNSLGTADDVWTKRRGPADWISKYPLLRKYVPLVREDLTATYSRDLGKWLVIAPVIGLITGLLTTALVIIILNKLWPDVLGYFLRHHWSIVPVMILAFAVTGLIMQFLTPDPDEHSTEEIITSYHEHQGDIDIRSFIPKLIAAITTVGFGGSAALEGPSIYGGGAIGSALWSRFRRWKSNLGPRDRRIMLITGAAAGMGAVFRAPLTGIVFALEMPYKDDLAHEALVPSLIASVVAYATLASFLGGSPLFDFASTESFTRHDLLWCAALGVVVGLIAMVFSITFRRTRRFIVALKAPHWIKMAVGGLLTGICGLVFLSFFNGILVPLGPNYEAVQLILSKRYGAPELIVFGGLKLCATIFSLGFGGVSAMFVPLFLSGGSFGTAFAQLLHRPAFELYAAVGMAALIAAGYKTPLAAVAFVAEATGGHAFIVPALIGAAVAYAVSGDASVSGEQRLHESVRVQELSNITVSQVMQRKVISVQAGLSLREFTDFISPHYRHTTFPVFDDRNMLGTVSWQSLAQIPPEKWNDTQIRELVDPDVPKVSADCDLLEGFRLLSSERRHHMLLVISSKGEVEGVVTKSDILEALKLQHGDVPAQLAGAASHERDFGSEPK